MRKSRPLSPSEAALWRAVAEKVTPLEPSVPPPPAPTSTASARREPPPRPAPTIPVAAALGPPRRLEAGDPKEARRVARGRREIEASLDLHGLTQEQAYTRLLRFVDMAGATGARTLLVVTGKGTGEARIPFAEAPRGVLRQRFLDWVEAEPLRGRIASVRPAHQRHGGRGAFYVFLKRKRPGREAAR